MSEIDLQEEIIIANAKRIIIIGPIDDSLEDDKDADYLFRCWCGDFGISSLRSLTLGEVTHCGCQFDQ